MKKLLLLLLCVCLFPLSARAQLIEAWTRGLSVATRDAIVARTSFAPVAGGSSFFRALNTGVTPLNMPSTPDKLIYSVVHYSKVFSKKEQQFLLPFDEQTIKIGKVAFAHDRSAAIYNQLQLDPADKDLFSELAFREHQEKLEQLGGALEKNLIDNAIPYSDGRSSSAYDDFISLLQLVNSDFERGEIAHLIQGVRQPLFPVLRRNEIEYFASLKDLTAQRAWVSETIDLIKNHQQALLSRDFTELAAVDFRVYYLQKLRLQYFEELQNLLAKSTAPRQSLIYRYRAKISDDLPLMTDAERLGYLQYKLDTFEGSAQEYDALRKLLAKQQEFSEPYATAQALGLPYEMVLRVGNSSPLLLKELRPGTFGEAPADLEREANLAITKLDQQLVAMRTLEPQNLAFYSQYYRLVAQKEIYENQLVMQSLFSKFK